MFHRVCFVFKFDKELQERWNAAVDAGCFAYKLDNVEGRVVPGKYQVFVQVIQAKLKCTISQNNLLF